MMVSGAVGTAFGQGLAGIRISGTAVGLPDGPLPRMIVVGRVDGRDAITTEASVRRTRDASGILISADFPSRPSLPNMESLRFEVISPTGSVREFRLTAARVVPLLDLPGFPTSETGPGRYEQYSRLPDAVREAYGIPTIQPSASEFTFGSRRPLTFRFRREDMRGPYARQLSTRLLVGDGIRADSSITLALHTYDGRLLQVETGAFRDNSRPIGSIALPIPIGHEHFTHLQAFFLRRRFENGAALPGAPIGATGDDARFGLSVLSESGDMIHQFSGLQLRDTTNASFRFPGVNLQTPGPFWADALSIWLQTGDRGLPPRLPVMLTLHFKGGFTHSARLPIVSSAFVNATQPGGCGQFVVFLRDLRLPMSQRSGLMTKDEPNQPTVPGFPIHFLQRISFSIIREGSNAPRDFLWDVKGLIITAGRATEQFPIWADGVNQVNLVSQPNWNKTFRMEGSSGPANSNFQHSILLPQLTQTYRLKVAID